MSRAVVGVWCEHEPMVGSSALAERSPAGFVRPGEWAVGAVAVLLQVLAPRTGVAAAGYVPAWTGPVVVLLALGQGAAVAMVRWRPVPASGLLLACYAGQSLVVGAVPPVAAWAVIWSLGSGRTSCTGAVKLTSAVAAATGGVVYLADFMQPGSGASVLLVLVTAVISLAAVLLRTERARVEAVRRRGAAEERLRIARDLHDLVGHGLSVVAVQSSTARMALDAGDNARVRQAMAAVESSSRTAMVELRHMLGVLTAESGEAPAPGLDDIEALVRNVRAGGVVIDLETAGDLQAVPRAAQLCAYRVVQEALTNAVKHAPGSLVRVAVRAADHRLSVAVESSGGSPTHPGPTDGGSGLKGLRSRVAAMAGEFHSERTADGWLLRAELPLPHPNGPPTGLAEGPS